MYALKITETPTLQTSQTTPNPWKTMEFNIHRLIEKLLLSATPYWLLLTDSLSSLFISTVDTITSPRLTELFVLHVFSKYGIPSHVTSNRGIELVSTFFCLLGKVLDTKHHFTSGYHPEGDGQTECTNQTLKQYLWIYFNYQQDNWSDLLTIVEFAYNSAQNATMGLTPFYANKGYHPNLTIHPEWDIASLWAWDYMADCDELHQ